MSPAAQRATRSSSPTPGRKTCSGCFAPMARGTSRCNRCGRSSGSSRTSSPGLRSVRSTCPLCKRDRLLQKFSFGILAASGPNRLTELEMAACGPCIRKSEEIRESGTVFKKLAGLAGVFTLFNVIQWLSVESSSLIYSLGFVVCGLAAAGFMKLSSMRDQAGIREIVGKHPRVVDLSSRTNITLLDSSGLSRQA